MRRSASGRARSRTASSSSTAPRSGSRASTATSTIRTRAMSSPRSPCARDIELMKQANVNAVRTCHYPERSALVRALRRIRPLRRRRSRHRIPRHGLRPEPGQGPGLGPGPPRPGRAHGRARQEPPLGHHLVARQRGRRRRQFRASLRLAQEARSVAARPVRAGRAAVPHGHLLPDVRFDREHGQVRLDEADAAPHPVRIRPLHGQLDRQPPGLLGRDRKSRPAPGRFHLGLGRPGLRRQDRHGPVLLGLRRRLRPLRRPVGPELLLQRHRRARPDAAPRLLRGEEGLSVRQVPRRRPRSRERSRSTNRYDFIGLERFDLDWELVGRRASRCASGTVAKPAVAPRAQPRSSGCPSPASSPSRASSISSTSRSGRRAASPGLPKGHIVAAEQIALPGRRSGLPGGGIRPAAACGRGRAALHPRSQATDSPFASTV